MLETMSEADVPPVGLLETLAAGVAHEVRNPLNSLQINVGILEQDLLDLEVEPDAHAFLVLRRIAGEIKRLDDFVSEFLRFARLPQPRLERHSVRLLLADLAAFLKPEFSKKGVALDCESRGTEFVWIDRTHLEQAVLNLALNALQATPLGGHVKVRSRADERRLVVTVEDDGDGMTSEVRQMASTPFFTTRENGTGLGLALVERVAREHGGSVEIASRPGGGTSVRLVFPQTKGA